MGPKGRGWGDPTPARIGESLTPSPASRSPELGRGGLVAVVLFFLTEWRIRDLRLGVSERPQDLRSHVWQLTTSSGHLRLEVGGLSSLNACSWGGWAPQGPGNPSRGRPARAPQPSPRDPPKAPQPPDRRSWS